MSKPPAPEPSVPPAYAPPAPAPSPPPAVVAPTAPAQVGSGVPGQATPSNTGAGPTAWRVQLASFSDRPHALALRNKLRAKGYQAFVQEVRARHRLMYRVLIGPGMSRARADALQARLRKDTKLSGIVIPAAGR